jgi:hypothetical protein
MAGASFKMASHRATNSSGNTSKGSLNRSFNSLLIANQSKILREKHNSSTIDPLLLRDKLAFVDSEDALSRTMTAPIQSMLAQSKE